MKSSNLLCRKAPEKGQIINAFAAEIDYSRGILPTCDDLSERAAILAVASCLTDTDVDDIVTAFRKVARAVL